MRVADAIEFDDPPPSELKKIWHTKRYGNPYSSGWLEWPAGEPDRLAILTNINDAFSGYKSAGVNVVEWTKRNPDLWKIIGKVKKQRRLNSYAKELGGEFHDFARNLIDQILDGETHLLVIFDVSGFDIPEKVNESYIKGLIND